MMYMPQPTNNYAGLTNRCQQALVLLKSGRTEKEVATEMGISQHTVHVYVKRLYRAYRVTSRAELLAQFIAR
jgi:DNA-binding CsgD family transcriptional regulator